MFLAAGTTHTDVTEFPLGSVGRGPAGPRRVAGRDRRQILGRLARLS
jgi:hypothetical protein